ncbi:lysosomal alpha-glucosidase-like, partial [Saccoglossus kowalevskii]
IFDPNNQCYEVPIDVPTVEKSASLDSIKYEFKYNHKSERFGISIIRKSSKTVLFNCGIGPLIFADQFIQLSSSLASKYIYGLGEHRGSFLQDVNWSRYAFWSRDVFHA